MTRFFQLLRVDFVLLSRDPMYAAALAAPFLLAALARFGLPYLSGLVAPWVDLAPYYPFIGAFVVLLTPMMFGWVAGFLLLEERDDHVLEAIAVTPARLPGFLGWRLALPIVFSVVASIAVVPVSGLADFPLARLVPAALLAAVEAPMLTAFLVAFAEDKVQGLALAKAANVGLLAPIALAVVPDPWHLFAGILPPYWVVRALMAPSALDAALSLAAGAVAHGLLLWWLLRRVGRRLG